MLTIIQGLNIKIDLIAAQALIAGGLVAGNGIAGNVVADLTTNPGYTTIVVPEPATISLLGLGALALLRRKK